MSNILPPNSDPLRPGASTNSRMALPRMIRFSAMGLALAGVAAFGVIVYSAYNSTPTTPDQVPLITADNSPLRERPIEEGGMQIANRDSTVYSQIDGSTPQPGIERLLPSPEEPLDPVAPSELSEPRRPDGTPALTPEEIRIMQQQRRLIQQQRGDAGEQAMQQLSEIATNVPAGVAQGHTSTVIAQAERIDLPTEPVAEAPVETPVAAAPAPVPEPAAPARDERIVAQHPQPPNPAQVVSPAPTTVEPQVETPIATLSQAQVVAQGTRPNVTEPVPVPPAQPAQPTAQETRQAAAVAPAAGNSTGRLIQLGAVRSEEAARNEWTRLQAKYQAQLGSLAPEIQQVDLGARGIYWRIRGGSVTDAQGKQICEALKAQGQSCLVVSR